MIVHSVLFVVIISHPSIVVHNKNIYCSGIRFEIQTFLGSVFSMLYIFSVEIGRDVIRCEMPSHDSKYVTPQ